MNSNRVWVKIKNDWLEGELISEHLIDKTHIILINNETYYCSELIFEAFEKDSIFQLKPMTFLHPKTKDTLKVWKEYYSDLNTNIPEGNPGINPGIMSLSNKIEMVHFYGIPDGLNN